MREAGWDRLGDLKIERRLGQEIIDAERIFFAPGCGHAVPDQEIRQTEDHFPRPSDDRSKLLDHVVRDRDIQIVWTDDPVEICLSESVPWLLNSPKLDQLAESFEFRSREP